jgi:CcmD family protein
MVIHPVFSDNEEALPYRESAAPRDTVTANTEVPVAEPLPLERVMLPHDKIFVVLAVVLVIWFGLLFFLFRTDRKIKQLERTVNENIPE